MRYFDLYRGAELQVQKTPPQIRFELFDGKQWFRRYLRNEFNQT